MVYILRLDRHQGELIATVLVLDEREAALRYDRKLQLECILNIISRTSKVFTGRRV